MTASFPVARPRRLRRTPALRALVAETSLRPRELVLPVFVAVVAIAYPMLAGSLIWQGELEEAERWLVAGERALQSEIDRPRMEPHDALQDGIDHVVSP